MALMLAPSVVGRIGFAPLPAVGMHLKMQIRGVFVALFDVPAVAVTVANDIG